MNGHLSDEQWAAALLDPGDQVVAGHLRQCEACQAELSSFVKAIGKAHAGIFEAADRPEPFWRKQRAAISARLANRVFPAFWKRLVWVAATMVLILVSTTLLSRRNVTSLPPQPATSDTDDALMLSVQQSIGSDLPQALRPAALLAQEVNQATIVRSHSRPAQVQGE
jgi:hypothetical protein